MLLGISLLVLGGSTAQLLFPNHVAVTELTKRPCRAFLCDDFRITQAAYEQQLAGTPQTLADATGALSDLLVRDPASPRRWADLGDALAQAGALGRAGFCFNRALFLGSASAQIQVDAASFYLRHGNRQKGLRCVARVLSIAPSLSETALSYASANGVTAQELLHAGFPAEKAPVQTYIRYLMSRSDTTAAETVWNWMSARYLVDIPITTDYSNFLLAQNRLEHAAETWAAQVGYRMPQYRQTEYLFNGDFEAEPIPGAAFDWKITPQDGTSIERDRQSRSGNYSLRIRFDGSANLSFNGIAQKVVLNPGEYRLQYYLRADHVTTDQGVSVRIAGTQPASGMYVETEPILGTTDWKLVAANLVVPPPTKLIDVSFIRRPSLRFDNKISGTVWIDCVSLRRIK